MDVEAAEGRDIEERLPQDLPVCGDHEEIGVDTTESFERPLTAQALRLEEGHPALLRQPLDRGRGELPPATGGSVGLRDR